MNILIGYTGFVGSNLYKQQKFDGVFNSKNIADSFGSNPDLCVYAGIRAEKFAADKFPQQDLSHIKEAIENIKQINPKKLILVSTVDVIPSPQKEDIFEDTSYRTDRLTPYGRNRLLLENEVHKLYSDALIIRLPALFGDGLKKNFIYDLIHFIPVMLKKEKFEELSANAADLRNFYAEDANGFFRIAEKISSSERAGLKSLFKSLNFSALNFTDSRSKFAFYNLKYLWAHMETLLESGVKLAHMASEPVPAAEIYRVVYGGAFFNEISAQPFDYSFFKTRHTALLGGKNGYIFEKSRIISEIADFVNE
ncbi:MAG: NAD(P)-dependent oxidoreductase [Endomicrobia bacterium]|nr:NAD(P)-dependent oxidoreductase [Endomicrobiia bacterium]